MVTFLLPPETTLAECLAWDEALLDLVEDGSCGPALWFWEAPAHGVVVGYGQTPSREVRLEACRADGVPVLRRCSGGGTVVQGPGCLSYAIALPIDAHPDLATVSGTNAHVMEQQRGALARVVAGSVAVCGHTDLVWDGRKVSGNAQRRRRHALLFHGTFLLGLDLQRVTRWLRTPSAEPDYRGGRSHEAFLANLPCPPHALREAIATAWHAAPAPIPAATPSQVRRRMEDRYGRATWHERRE